MPEDLFTTTNSVFGHRVGCKHRQNNLRHTNRRQRKHLLKTLRGCLIKLPLGPAPGFL